MFLIFSLHVRRTNNLTDVLDLLPCRCTVLIQLPLNLKLSQFYFECVGIFNFMRHCSYLLLDLLGRVNEGNGVCLSSCLAELL